ncbi:MAG: NCS2 family permease [Verrucomicrobia bacterium]|nr:NCS2 family permease [Verrucomicrobiota bacterium]
MRATLERIFGLAACRTTVRTELLAGLTTFLTMAYIIFVQPAVLSGAMFNRSTGLDFGAVTTATCLSAAVASAIMGLYARYPIAQAPGMGENFFFVFTALPAAAAAGFSNAWQVGLGLVFISGVLFLALSWFGFREKVMETISPSLKSGIAAGIGLFIAFIGLQNAGLIVPDPGTAVKLNSRLLSPDLLVFFTGLVVTAALHARRVPGAILWGLAAATTLAVGIRLALPVLPASLRAHPWLSQSLLVTRFALAREIVAPPAPLSPTLLKLDVAHALTPAMLPFVAVFLFMVLFDTVGTLIGVAGQAGLIVNNRLPRARQAFVSDALGTTLGACLGTSTVTSFIESAAGVQAGGRTGLTSLTTAALFLLALFFGPLIAMVGSYAPITAPALVFVGAMMLHHIRHIDWSDATESFPAFLILVGIPFTFSIADGLALGFVSHPVLKLLSGRGKQVSWLLYGLAALLVAYFALVRSRIG